MRHEGVTVQPGMAAAVSLRSRCDHFRRDTYSVELGCRRWSCAKTSAEHENRVYMFDRVGDNSLLGNSLEHCAASITVTA
jgi:hypothetical protein